MRMHSQVGLVTNSSSETYVWPNADIETSLKVLGAQLIVAFHLEGISDLDVALERFDDFFEIKRELTRSAIDNLYYARKPSWAPEGIETRLKDVMNSVIAEMAPAESVHDWYTLPNADEIRSAIHEARMRLIDREIDLNAVPMLDQSEYDELSDGNLDFSLVVKSTGVKFDFHSIFEYMYQVDSCYNG